MEKTTLGEMTGNILQKVSKETLAQNAAEFYEQQERKKNFKQKQKDKKNRKRKK